MDDINNIFIEHISQYIGKTVTVYTVSSNHSDLKFTGVLLSVNEGMISLVTKVGSPPSQQNYQNNNYNNQIQFRRSRMNSMRQPVPNSNEVSLGSITDIPIDKISAFVHNAV